MLVGARRSTTRRASVFASAASRYWLEIFPEARYELRRWRARAGAIPDPVLRRHALVTHQMKSGNAEGAAALAILAPRGKRRSAARLLAAYQSLVDYLDTATELPVDNAEEITLSLHQAQVDALRVSPPEADYYAIEPPPDDGSYLEDQISTCRQIFTSFPSYSLVSERSQALAAGSAQVQSLTHGTRFGLDEESRLRWARVSAPSPTGLHWWELAAASASSLGILALLAVSTTRLTEVDVARIEDAYFPWISVLNIMLDSLVDWSEDRDTDQVSHISHYRSTAEAADRLSEIATQALSLARELPQGELHETIVRGMAGYYLAHPGAWLPSNEQISRGVLDALGPMGRPAVFVHRARRFAGQLTPRARW